MNKFFKKIKENLKKYKTYIYAALATFLIYNVFLFSSIIILLVEVF